MTKLLRYLRSREWAVAVLALAFIVVQVWLDLKSPEYMAEITRLVQVEGSTMPEILTAGGKMLACSLGSLLAAVATAVCSSFIAAGFGGTMRAKMFHKVQSFSMEEIGRFSTPSLITRSTNDVMQVQMLIVLGLQMLIKAPITAAWAITKIAGKRWEWTAATGVAILVLLAVVGICLLIATPRFRRMQRLTDDLNRVSRENLSGLSVVRTYNAEAYQQDRFDVVNDTLTNNQLVAYRTMVFLMPTIQATMSGLSLAIYWIGAAVINSALMADKIALFSDMMVFSQYAIMVVMAFMMLVMIFMILPRAQVAASRINEVLDTEASIEDGALEQGKPGQTGEIEFRDVTFRYPDAEGSMLRHVSFSAHRGETVALIGSTGSGKSTVINLIPRFYDATWGEVLVDGVNVREYTTRALRNKIGYVSQRATLFGGTVSSNIAYGDNGRGPVTDSDVEAAVGTAQAAEFVEKMEGAYQAQIAQGGTNLSGGQRQRLSIARAIARKPEILIFDDSFSALDYRTDRVLRDALDRECADTTRIIVAQRIGTIRDADRIVVLEDGRVVGQGTHEELMRDCETYQQIALSQLSEEELA